jgi:hydrogenase expression/formation protein HypC
MALPGAAGGGVPFAMMCLGIPALVLGPDPADAHQSWVDVGGARRRVNMSLLEEEGVSAGDWVLVHVGFALARLDDEEARGTIAMLEGMQAAYADELAAMARSVTAAPGTAAGSPASARP